jgi:hypothetical protein
MNRTLKDEFGLGRQLPSRLQAFRLVNEAVELYNQKKTTFIPKYENT